jgi:tetratricopeptide (TPR) repeat protein
MTFRPIIAIIAGFVCAGAACAQATRVARQPAGQNPPPVAATLSDLRRLYDAGRFADVVAAVDRAAPGGAPELLYLAAQSQEKLNNVGGARSTYERLVAGPRPAWAEIGRSGIALLDRRLDDALASADRARRDAAIPEAQFQRGLVLMARGQYGPAADAFDQTVALDPSFASAHYYGGLANYRIQRIDRMTAHFEAFLRLAPNAPERSEVESILRTVR